MANFVSNLIDNFRHRRLMEKSNQLLNEIDTIARQGISRPRSSDQANLSPTTSSNIGKLKKVLAPTRQLSKYGIFTNRFNMTDVYAAYTGENLVKFSADKYTDAVVRNGFYIKSKNAAIIKYLGKRLLEMQVVSKDPFEEYVKDFIISIILYGNTYSVKHRQSSASSGRKYVNHEGNEMVPIASLFIEDSRKIVVGEGPNGKNRFARIPCDLSDLGFGENLNNPSLVNNVVSFALRMSGIATSSTGSNNAFFRSMYNNILRYFRVNTRREEEYVIYDEDEMDHIRYHHVPGEKIAMPPFWGTLNDIDTLRRIEENVELLTYQYGHPILHSQVGLDDKPGSPAEVQDITRKLQEMESNGYIVTTNRSMLKFIGAEGQALRVEAYLKYFYNRVLTGLWLSEVSVGQGDTSNRATANVLDKISQEKVIELQKIFSAHMQRILIELLQETGAELGWILLPENIPTFEFNEVDLEGRIRKESHISTLWQANMITEDEMRISIGKEPFSESDMKETYIHRVSIPLAQAKADAVGDAAVEKAKQTQLKPKNQHGTSGPAKGINK